MDTLKDLNEQGNTIVMVTHDPVIAKYASRTVHVVDGKIEETGVQAKPKNKKGEK